MSAYGIFSDSFIVAQEIIDEILTLGAEDLYMSYISVKSIPFGINSTLELLVSVVECKYMRYETEKSSEWEESVEPRPGPIDTWARNAIPTQIKYKIPTPEVLFPLPIDSKSVKSHRSRISARSAIGGKRSKGHSLLKNPKDPDSIGETPLPFPMPPKKLLITEEEENLRIKKEKEFKKKSEEAERLKKMKEELEEKEKKIKKESGEMKNKAFTYDSHGNIMFVNSLKYDYIPKIFTEVEIKPFENVKDVSIGKIVPIVSKKHVEEASRLKTAPVRDQEWVKNMTSIGPGILDLIKLAPGVSLTDGTRVKYSAITNSASSKLLPRKDYAQLVTPLKPNTLTVNYDKRSPAVSSQDSFKKNSRISSHKDLLEEIPDYNYTESEIEQQLHANVHVKNEKSHGKITVFHPDQREDEQSQLNKFNQEIMKNKNWGNNHGEKKKPLVPEKLPKKPSTKELREIFGDIMKKPKDQPFISSKELWEIQGPRIKKPRDRPYVEKIEKKSKMPPPPYGFTMIGALPEYGSLVKSATNLMSR